MAFVFARNFPFENGPCFARASGSGSCRASAQAFAGPCFRGRRACGPRNVFDGVEMVETPEAYLIYFDASEFKREDVHVKVTDRTLTLSAKKDEAVAVEKAWSIPEDVQLEDITAKFASNELIISLPRLPQEPKASFDVRIETGSGPTRPASPPHEPLHQPSDAALRQEANEQDVDGSWVEVADEDVTRAKEKGKASNDTHVLEDADS